MSKPVSGTHRHDASGQDECRDAADVEAGLERTEWRAPIDLEARRINGHKGVSRVTGGLRSLATGDRVLHRVGVQGQLAGKLLEKGPVGLTQIEPDEGAFLLQVIRDLLKWEVLELEPALAPQSGANDIAAATGHGTQSAPPTAPDER